MILYRAINSADYIHYQEKSEIICNLLRSDNSSKLQGIIKEEVDSNFKFGLDRIIAHIDGQKMENTCWISTSSDFNFLAREFSIPQSGKFNADSYRKYIAFINSSDEIMLNNLASTDQNHQDKFIGKFIDLTNNKLQIYTDKKYIQPLYRNEDSYFYNLKNMVRDFNQTYNGHTTSNIQGYSNFATSAHEYVFYKKICGKNIIKVLSPLLQDIIFTKTCNKSIEETNMIIQKCLIDYENIDTDIFHKYEFSPLEKEIINYLYVEQKPGEFNTLIHLIPKLYTKRDNIMALYEGLKEIKRNILRKITHEYDIELLDDHIYVVDYEHIVQRQLIDRKLTKKNNNDVIYYTDMNNELQQGKIKQLTKNKNSH
jgi:hypothetical protein